MDKQQLNKLLKEVIYESQFNGKYYKWSAHMKKRFLQQYDEDERKTEDEFWICVEDWYFRDFDRDN